ncbi:MAG: 23S rRNA (uracil(1939)-C(5))-methyltransferase RlmD [Alistipes sp.]|nr:23S rRNA (uracil(1939)-C(5))-methyltransferase RlmD [Alistipes sp.]
MGKRRKDYPLIEGLHITTLAAEGKAMGKVDNQVVFVPMTVPGDVVDVQIRKHHRRYMEGTVVRFVEKSPLRTEPFCQHFGICGGCKWQNLPYEEQLRQKTKQVEDQLVRIGHLTIPEVRPCLGSARTEEYRNKLEFTFADRRWLTYEEIAEGGDIEPKPAVGFHIPGCFDKVLDIEKCHLQNDINNRIRLSIKQFCINNGYSFHNARAHEGLMRTMVVRTASTGEIMVIVVFNENDKERINALMEHLKVQFPEITSLIYMINEKWNDSLGDREPICYAGKDHIIEQMEGLQFKVGPKSFYQTNSEQAYELYKVTREFADLKPTDVLYDLYTGTGTIANFCARRAAKVVGVEYVPEAIEDAKINSMINGIENTTFYAGDMKDVLSDEFVSRNGRPDVIILDPPRAGVDEKVLEVIKRAAPERMVYVSCNPSTQARDLALLSDMYEILAVQPVDMFPHTHHVENVVKLHLLS